MGLAPSKALLRKPVRGLPYEIAFGLRHKKGEHQFAPPANRQAFEPEMHSAPGTSRTYLQALP